ncbi:MAG TPA: aldehyde dehydrogenase family protein [Rubrobacter sp.]|nr:aldehyde dehydrogenase family protein [Rubrobacter sp.]
MQETQRAVKTYENYIDGEWVAASSGETYETRDPGRTGEVVGRYPLSTAEDVDRAVEAAYRAFQEWRDVPAPERMGYVHGLIEIWRRRRDELAAAVTLEMGKPILEARTEVDRGVGEMQFTAGEALRAGGETLPSGRRDLLAYTVREPIGVVAAVTPWNFPVLSPIRKVIPALVHGCTVVLKPASLTPLTSVIIVEMLKEAGVPAGVVNLVIGRGGEVGDALVTHPRVNGITFTGSTEVGLGIYEKAAPSNKKVQLEMGGKNGCVVAKSKAPKEAAAQIVAAAYQTSGQRCTAISRVIVLEEQREELEAALVEEAEKLKVGYGLDDGTTMGPLSSRNQLQRSVHYVDLAQKDGARVILGGREATGEAFDQGHYYEPTILTDVKPGTPAALDEIFGPVLVVTPVEDFAEALEVHNEVQYGLTSSIFTDDMDLARAFVRGSEAGMVHVNNGTVSEGHMPFGGGKQSGMGAYGIGATNKGFFTNLKVVYHQHGEGSRPPIRQLLEEEDPA